MRVDEPARHLDGSRFPVAIVFDRIKCEREA
jgi:hypothetical protein